MVKLHSAFGSDMHGAGTVIYQESSLPGRQQNINIHLQDLSSRLKISKQTNKHESVAMCSVQNWS